MSKCKFIHYFGFYVSSASVVMLQCTVDLLNETVTSDLECASMSFSFSLSNKQGYFSFSGLPMSCNSGSCLYGISHCIFKCDCCKFMIRRIVGLQQLLHVPYISTDFGRHAFSYSSPVTWNSIPISIKNWPSLYTLWVKKNKALQYCP